MMSSSCFSHAGVSSADVKRLSWITAGATQEDGPRLEISVVSARVNRFFFYPFFGFFFFFLSKQLEDQVLFLCCDADGCCWAVWHSNSRCAPLIVFISISKSTALLVDILCRRPQMEIIRFLDHPATVLSSRQRSKVTNDIFSHYCN